MFHVVKLETQAIMLGVEKTIDWLGLGASQKSRAILDLDEAVQKGLPIETVERISRALAPGDVAFKYRLVTKTTWNRRRHKHERLSPEESARVERLARVWTFGLEVWQSEEDARRFFSTPHPLLNGRLPRDVAASELGARRVEEILGRLLYGTGA
jgi:putative toxin-antitoxin system antitoxin component (TIGR02293 family)